MRGSADETECLPVGLGATVGSVSPSVRTIFRLSLRGGKHGWRIAIQTLNQGKMKRCHSARAPLRVCGRGGG